MTRDPAQPFSADEQFGLLMESVTDYSIFFTDPQGHIVTWNTGAERILGWSEAEIVGQHARIIYTPEDRAKGADHQELTTAKDTGRAEDERWHLRKDGSRFWASGIVTCLRDEAGQLRGYCKILRDLTERKRWEDDLQADHEERGRVVETLQNTLLMVPSPNAFAGLNVKALYQSASDGSLVGGDFFDVFAIDQDKIALAVGDATGHGLEAVTYTAEVKFALRALLHEHQQPADALGHLNAFIADRERLDASRLGSSYIALAVCVVDTSAGGLTCAWAGIEPPFLLRADTSQVLELLDCNGPLLGVEQGAVYAQQTVALGGGDVLAMSSDGLTEARRGSGNRREFFGYDGLVQAVREEVARHPSSLSDAGAAVAARAREFAGGTISDDVCLLLARCTVQSLEAQRK